MNISERLTQSAHMASALRDLRAMLTGWRFQSEVGQPIRVEAVDEALSAINRALHGPLPSAPYCGREWDGETDMAIHDD